MGLASTQGTAANGEICALTEDCRSRCCAFDLRVFLDPAFLKDSAAVAKCGEEEAVARVQCVQAAQGNETQTLECTHNVTASMKTCLKQFHVKKTCQDHGQCQKIGIGFFAGLLVLSRCLCC